METAKKIRTQQRRIFSKAANEFDAEEANLEIYDKIMKLKVIEEKAILMLKAEEVVKQFLFSGDIKIESNSTEKKRSMIWKVTEIIGGCYSFKLKQILLS